jgi:hypothetical protein
VLTAIEIAALATNYAATRNVDISQYYLAVISFDFLSRSWLLHWEPFQDEEERILAGGGGGFSVMASDEPDPKLNFMGPKK